VAGWNRALGPRGFLQYQFVVHAGAERTLAEVIEAVQRERCAPFLGTLKRFGIAGRGHLSFPMPGWSLAIDLPAGSPRLAALLDRMDAQVATVGAWPNGRPCGRNSTRTGSSGPTWAAGSACADAGTSGQGPAARRDQ
jgi:hypothetical protein